MFSLAFKLRSGFGVAVFFLGWRGLWFLPRATFFLLLVFVDDILILPDGFVGVVFFF